MNYKESQDRLTQAFDEIPRLEASRGFTRDVLTALDRRDTHRSGRVRGWIWAVATTLILASLLTVGYGYQRQQAAERAYREQVEELRSRYRQLRDEVATVRHEAESPDTRLYLGGDDQLDLVLDLNQHPAYLDSAPNRQDVRPASWEQ